MDFLADLYQSLSVLVLFVQSYLTNALSEKLTVFDEIIIVLITIFFVSTMTMWYNRLGVPTCYERLAADKKRDMELVECSLCSRKGRRDSMRTLADGSLCHVSCWFEHDCNESQEDRKYRLLMTMPVEDDMPQDMMQN